MSAQDQPGSLSHSKSHPRGCEMGCTLNYARPSHSDGTGAVTMPAGLGNCELLMPTCTTTHADNHSET
ncbi:unnamed protein product [Protopolystoma xenopodis]|uniref:Uncharacterized protein n=1 Tax=Protopolystoma xenopodis TaxID=117903 RepID=A0A448XFF4_9PLAT|nr:unnamed protein product [Protopolystoma xenopodis]